jgi:hypothetical protein
MLGTFGREAHEIWNVADPANPVLITRLDRLKDTHKSWWECDTGMAFARRAVIDLLASDPVRVWIEGRLDRRQQAVL